jgi:Na+-translocating ferredoxin:NAD+ oxidoreductase subunit E
MNSPTPWAALWRHNPALVRLLALSPLLALSHSLVTALGIGLATLAVTAASAPLLAALRGRLSPDHWLAAATLLIATLAAGVELLLLAWRYPLSQALGIYVPLIAATALLLLVPDTERDPRIDPRDGLAAGLGLLIALLLLGGALELLARGTLFGDLELLFGEGAAGWELRLLPEHYGFPFWALPAGGFIAAGLAMALHRVLESGRRGENSEPVATAARARVVDAPGRDGGQPPE